MLKRVDVAVETALSDAQAGTWTPGLKALGLEQNGLGWALDENNEALITQEMREAAALARAQIIGGTLKIHDYTSDRTCPVSAD